MINPNTTTDGKKKHAFSKLQIQKEFVNQFREVLNKLGLKQSDVFREAMQEVIDKANG